MASATTATDTSRFVGSISWIHSEISNMQTLVESTLEDFAYAAKDELDWLGDRMDSILKDSNSEADLLENVMSFPYSEHAKLAISPLKSQVILRSAGGKDADKENVNPRQNSSKLEQSSCAFLPQIPPVAASSTATSSSPTARCQATLPAVAEFNTDPISLPSSSSALGDDYVEGDFFGALERKILALPPGEGHTLMTDTTDNELSPTKVIGDQYDRTENDDGASQLETSIHYNDVRETYERLEAPTSVDIMRRCGTVDFTGDSDEELLGSMDIDQVPTSSLTTNQEEVDEGFTLAPQTVTRISPTTMSSAVKATPAGSSFKLSREESSPSQQVSFYSANEEESMQDEDGPSTSSKRSGDVFATSSPAVARILRQQPLAHSTPSNGLSNVENPHYAQPSSSIASTRNTGQPRNSLSRHSPSSARSAPTHRVMISPTTPKSPAATQITAIVPLKTLPAAGLTVRYDAPGRFDSIPAKAPLINQSIGKRLSGLSSGESLLLATKTSESGTEASIDNAITGRNPQQEPASPAAQGSIVSEERKTPQEVLPEFSIKLTKAELLAGRQTTASSSESLDSDNKQQPSAPYTIPSLPSYRNLHDMMTEPQDEEEDWIPLSRATPAPRSRFMTQALPHNMLLHDSHLAKQSADVVLEEDDEEEEGGGGGAAGEGGKGRGEDEEEDSHLERANQECSAGQDSPLKVTIAESPTRRYYASTAASRSKLQASPVRQSPMKSPSRPNGLPVRRPLSPTREGGRSLKSPVRPFSTRPVSPVHAQSPLRNVVSRPPSPSRRSSNDGNASTKSGTQQSRPAPVSPARSGSALIRTGGVSQVASASSLAAATAAHAASQSPVTSAFKNMKMSTADVFRKARLLLFDSNSDNRQQSRMAGVHQDPKVNASPVKKPSQETVNSGNSPTSKSLYPDISGIVAESGGSPERPVIRAAAFEPNLANGNTTNPSKVLFPAHALRSGAVANARFSQQAMQLQLNHQSSQVSLAPSNTSQLSSISLSHTSGTSTQKTSLDNICDSGDSQLSPEASTSKSVSVSVATAAISTSAANSVSSSTSSNKTAGTQLKRVKSAIRKPPSRAKHAPVVVRVPMGAQRELEQQRKIAAAAALSQLSPPEVPDPQLATVNKPEEDKKAEQKREIERRRQETARRVLQQQQQQQDEKKMVEDDDQTRRKYNLANRNSRVPQAQTRTGGNLGVAEESKSLKRNFQGEGETIRMKAPIAPTTTDQPKRRRTDELTGSPLESRLRASVVRKDVVSKPAQQQQTSSQPQNFIKTAVTNQGRNIPFVEGVKFSSDKIRFAADNTTASRTNSNVNTLPSTTPGRQNLPTTQSTTQQFRLSQLSQMPVNSGDHIALPEIYSESEDDDDSSVILDWAHSPFLQEALRQQQRVDPDTVFGPVPPLLMEEVFRTRAGGTARFRPRSSSANWSNNDRVTSQEIDAYAAAMGYKYDNVSGNGSMHT
ncbi:hypothetical protein V1508DRAFT_412253 [Lipomyces doorenjongii]|uniref:uncharacterized protein n=1 Tax=Lipomyces doorenjongii TaxID=383834 RepID=UPI0034CD8E59